MAFGVWQLALIGMLIGFIPGLLLFEWLASPFGPGLWKLATPFTRVFLTVSQFLRGKGVLVKRKTGNYEIGTVIEVEDGEVLVQLSDTVLEIDPDNIRWGLFGKKPFGVTWEPGTELHELAVEGDGKINMAAVHRYLDGANETSAIDRTEEHAKAEYGGGDEALSQLTMAILVGAMLLLGSLTSFFALSFG